MSRALAGQFLVVILVVPILAMFGPRELARLRAQGHRRNSVGKYFYSAKIYGAFKKYLAGSDRENTIRHLVQMMSIRETQEESCEQMDAQLSSFVAQQLQLGERLQLLELVLDQDTRGSWVATKQTTARCTVCTSCLSCIYPAPLSLCYLFLYLKV